MPTAYSVQDGPMPTHAEAGAAVVPAHALALRTEVGLLRMRETRRVFDVQVHLGALGGGEHDTFVVRAQDVPVLDQGLRTEVVVVLAEQLGTRDPAVWVTRPGVPELHDVDLHWLSATDRAFAELGRPSPEFYAVTRYGWLDVRTGQGRSWKRLRLRPA
jgi:hypothetical protein